MVGRRGLQISFNEQEMLDQIAVGQSTDGRYTFRCTTRHMRALETKKLVVIVKGLVGRGGFAFVTDKGWRYVSDPRLRAINRLGGIEKK